jgi:hypothetical protein
MATPYRFESTSASSGSERQTAFSGDDLGLVITRHAKQRMSQRRIPVEAVCAALDYGRVYRTRGAVIYAVNRRSADQCRKDGSAITKLDGLQVICADSGSILTAYRNKDFRKLKPRGRADYFRQRGNATQPMR